MNLFVAIGMDQDAVLCTVCAAHRFVDDVVVVPPRHVGNRLGADRADASLFFPEIHQSTSSAQGLFHLYAEAFFKIDFPCRIVGVTVSFDLRVPGYWGCGGQAQPVLGGFPLLVFCLSKEAPVLISALSEVPVLYPVLILLWVSPPCPSPQGCKDGRIDMDKGLLGRGVSVKVCPSPYFGVECCNQPVCCGLFVLLDDLSDVCEERFDVLFRRACEKLPVVLTYILSEKVESILNVRYLGFLFREFQSSFTKKIYDKGFDFRFQYLFRDACDDEVEDVSEVLICYAL
jgi:hypothetical protein